MIKLLIMDADGLLVIGEKFRDVRVRELQIDRGKEREFFTGVFQECLVGKADLKESIAPYLPAFGWDGTVDAFLNWWFKTESTVNQPLAQYLQQLRRAGIKVVLAANQEKYRTQYVLEKKWVSAPCSTRSIRRQTWGSESLLSSSMPELLKMRVSTRTRCYFGMTSSRTWTVHSNTELKPTFTKTTIRSCV